VRVDNSQRRRMVDERRIELVKRDTEVHVIAQVRRVEALEISESFARPLPRSRRQLVDRSFGLPGQVAGHLLKDRLSSSTLFCALVFGSSLIK